MTENTRNILNRFLSILSGILAAFIVISFIELISNQIYPLPEDFDISDRDASLKHISGLSNGAFALILLGHGLGAYTGGIVTARMAKIQKLNAALFTGLILMVAGIYNIVAIPHPTWFSITLLSLYVPLTLLGGWIITTFLKPKNK